MSQIHTAVESVGITVDDMERSLEFYTTVLTFKRISDTESGSEYDCLLDFSDLRTRIVRLQLGDAILELTEYLNSKGRLIPADSRSNDQWFQHLAIVVSDIDQAYQRLCKYQVQQVSIAPQTLPASNPVSGGVKAYYFKDPDGHNLELIEFPPDKGDAKWQQTDRLFLGVDHTAIVVFNTEISLQLYRDCLGLELKSQSENIGVEQENLSRVQDPKVRVTSLKPQGGIGIELLEYLSPRNGRSTPTNVQANDLLHWQITFVVQDVATVVQQLNKHFSGINSEIVTLPETMLGFKQGILLRDGDRHGIRLVEK